MAFLEAMKSHFLMFAPKVAVGFIVFLIFWLAAAVAHRITRAAVARTKIQSNAVTLFGRISYYTLLVLGAAFSLGVAGVNVGALVAGLGLASLAIGVALQNTLSNVFSGALIMFYRPFKHGDHIKVSGSEGEVLEINLRYTRLRNKDSIILIPNSNFFTNPVAIHKPG